MSMWHAAVGVSRELCINPMSAVYCLTLRGHAFRVRRHSHPALRGWRRPRSTLVAKMSDRTIQVLGYLRRCSYRASWKIFPRVVKNHQKRVAEQPQMHTTFSRSGLANFNSCRKHRKQLESFGVHLTFVVRQVRVRYRSIIRLADYTIFFSQRGL